MAVLRRLLSALAALPLIQNALADRYPDCVSGPLKDNAVCQTDLDPAVRAAALVTAMTIDEKLVNLVNESPGSKRLGLPFYDWWSEALHGVAYSPGVHFAPSGNFSYATSFSNPITISATFDDELVEQIAKVIGTEARAFGNSNHSGIDFWTPNINPFKDPRWGRGLETPGEDPLRTSNYVKHLLRGMEWASQDPNVVKSRQIIATCKHYAAYDLEDWNGVSRHSFDAIVSLQDLVEYYLPPFKQCARDSNVGSIMCAYNSVNGSPSCANEYLMQTVLREHWNWTAHNNYIVSDCGAVDDIWENHKFVDNNAQAAGVAYGAGIDNTCGTANTIAAYNQSLLSEEFIDRALRRQYEGLIRADYFHPFLNNVTTAWRALDWKDVFTKDADVLALQSATDGIVLLKNDGTLPLAFTKNQTIAVVGMWANDTMARMLGNYNGRPPFYHTPLYAARQLGLNAKFANGPVNATSDYSSVIEAAEASDIIFYFGGIDISIEAEGKDRTDITWPFPQSSLLESLAALGKPVVVVQLGTQIDNSDLLSNPNISAILWTGYPGQYGGTAVFDIVTGAKAPAGRLPITQYPGKYVDQVPMTDMTLRPSNTSPGRTYKWYNNAVQSFGFGLHYTNFSVNFGGQFAPSAEEQVLHADELLAACTEPHKDLCSFSSLSVTVANTGTKTSDYVLLAFLTTVPGPDPKPIKSLAAYTRLRDIAPGEKRNVQVGLNVNALMRVKGNGDTVLYAGEYCVGLDVGGEVKTCFKVEVNEGEGVLLDSWPHP